MGDVQQFWIAAQDEVQPVPDAVGVLGEVVPQWVAGMSYGLYLLYQIPNLAAKRPHFGGSALTLDRLSVFGWHLFPGSTVQIYVGFVALVVNLLVAVLASVVLRAAAVSNGTDATTRSDYHADEGSDQVKPGREGAVIH